MIDERTSVLARNTIRDGLQELRAVAAGGAPAPIAGGGMGRQRRAGGGRKPLGQHDPGLLDALVRALDPVVRVVTENQHRFSPPAALPAGGRPAGP